MKTSGIIASLLLVGLSGLAVADPEPIHNLPYTGKLVSPLGAPVVGPVDLAIGFFGSEQGTDALSTVALKFQQVPLAAGVFAVNLSFDQGEYGRLFGNPARTVYLEVKDLTHDLAYRRQPFVPNDLPPPTVPRDLVNSAGAACLASPVAGGKFVALSFDPGATCAATCSASQPSAGCVRGWTLFQTDQSFDFGNECVTLSTAPGNSVKGRLCCCLTTSGPQKLLPPEAPDANATSH